MANVGFIGLGIMGRPMAKHLQDAGHKLFLHSRKEPPPDLVKGGGVACQSGKEVA
ncbi:MAG: NAD(P)-binding domain-containing protein, partial [Rhodomicrobium sp.]